MKISEALTFIRDREIAVRAALAKFERLQFNGTNGAEIDLAKIKIADALLGTEQQHTDYIPQPRKLTPRLPAEVKTMKAGENIVTDEKTAQCIAAYFRYHGRKSVRQRNTDGTVKTWVY